MGLIMKPVYVINGFLESGKTEFINFTLAQPYFRSKGTTLLLLCEEGEVEYEENLLKATNTVIELIEEEEDFNSSHLVELEKKYKPERIIVEWNGMWNYKNVKFPWYWKVEQQITTVDASTFSMYFTNMRSLLAEQMRGSEMIIFNRCDEKTQDLVSFKRNVKALNPKAEIIFEDENGEVDVMMDEDFPYDLNAPVIEMDDEGYGIWFIDSMDHLDRYVGKTIRFLAQVMHPAKIQKGYFVPGRMVMTCCADDINFLGYACQYDKADQFKEQDWVMVTAKVQKEYFADYGGEGPVLQAISVEPAKAPKEAIISFA